MDISDTTQPKSDQIDFDDFIGGDKTLTIKEVRRGPSAEQPIEVVMAEFERPWRPAKSMRRVLVAAWTADASTYVGKRVTLFGDSTVKWAGQEVGGVRIRALSHIDKPLSIALTVTRGKRAPYTVAVLPDAAPAAGSNHAAWVTKLTSATTLDELQSAWEGATKDGATRDPKVVAAKDARKAALS